MGRSQKAKGAAGEREFAERLSRLLGKEPKHIRRNLGAAREGGDDVTWGEFSFEVKRQETLHIDAWFEQASEQALRKKLVPALAYRKNRGGWKVVVTLEDFARLLLDSNEEKGKP